MIAVVVMVPVAVVAPSPCIFQVTTAILRLSAMFPVLAFLIVQLTLCIADSLLALSVIITAMVNKRPCGHCSAQERQNNKGRNECLGFLQHASSSDYPIHFTLGCRFKSQTATARPASRRFIQALVYASG